jgi:hypothetical protein
MIRPSQPFRLMRPRLLALAVLACTAGLALAPATTLAAATGTAASAASSPGQSAAPTVSPSQSAAPTVSPTGSPSPSPATSSGHPKPRPSRSAPSGPPTAPPGGKVFTGVRMWDPAVSRRLSRPAYVVVRQVSDLTNQVVQVSWRNFTPSSSVIYSPDTTDYPVMVAECATTHPDHWGQCFGANNGGVAGTNSPYGPMNTVYATTSPDGTGEADIQLLTAEEDNQLGCNVHSPCSLVIVPSQGGNIFESPANCSDHSQDTGQSDVGSIAFNSSYGECSWRDRIIVPLYFAPTPTDCPIRNPDFSVIGSPMLARAMGSWQAALCESSDPISIQYDSAQSEPLARTDFQSGLDDVALTTLPASGSSQHPYVYAPVAISAESIAYWIDNPVTGAPLTHLKLDPRLVLKLLTQSYDFQNEGCGKGYVPKGVGCDNAVDGNPVSLFADPEFKQLNPHVPSVGDGFQVPTVLSGESDMTWELTRWIAASPAAKGFADGSFDPWGMHVNTDYLDMALPTNSLTSMDSFLPIAHRYDPVFPLSQVAEYQVDNWYPATAWQPDTQGNYDKLSPELPGDRALFAIVDEADAAAFDLPVAALENADGQYVTPTAASMSAALGAMSTARNHVTQDLRENAKVAGAYPLTMVIYAMVPTRGISKAKAAKIAQFLDFVADSGQVSGTQPGELPTGYLPLTAAMRAETLQAASEVLRQAGDIKTTTKLVPTPTVAATPKATPRTVSLGYLTHPGSSGITRYALPVLLATGCLLAVAGMFSMAIGRGSAAAAGRLRKVRLPRLTLRGRNHP